MSKVGAKQLSRKQQRSVDEQRRAETLRLIGLCVLLAIVTFIVFVPVLANDFVAFDDMEAIVRNPDFNPPEFARFKHFWTEPVPDLYTPVMWTLWGLLAFSARTETQAGVQWDAAPFHFLNLACHIGAAIMALLVLRRLVRSDRAAFIGACVFALHPMQVEPVAWAAAMKTPLSGALALWSMWHYLRFSDAPPAAGKRWIHFGIATFAFVLALITKPTVVVLPLVMAIVEIFIRQRRIRDVWPLAPWVVISGLIGWVNTLAQSAPTVFHPPLWQRLLVVSDSLGFYLAKILLPYPLLPDYGRTPQMVLGSSWRLWTVCVPVALLCIIAIAVWRKVPWLVAAVSTFVLGVITTSGLIPYDYQIYTSVADRYAYLSLFGVAIAVAFWLRSRNRLIPIVAGVLVVFAVMTLIQCRCWRDTETLFQYTLRHNPKSLAAYRSLTSDAVDLHHLDKALEITSAGLAVRPNDEVLLHFRGNLAVARGDFDGAANAFRAAADSGLNRQMHLASLGAALAQGGHLDEAEAALREAIAIDPNFQGAQDNLKVLQAQRRQRAATAPTSGPS